MPKNLRKMLGDVNATSTVALQNLINTQNKDTIRKWCLDYAESRILPIFEKHCPGDVRPPNALNAANDYLDGKVKFPVVKNIILSECHQAARELDANPIAQAAAITDEKTDRRHEDYIMVKHLIENTKISYRRAMRADVYIMTDLLFLLYHDEGQASGLSREELLTKNKQMLTDTTQIFFLAFDGEMAVGVSHGSLRREYVNGANDGVKGYLEAIYVLPEYRKNGIAAELDKIIGRWAARNGCREMASACLLENTDSYKFHRKIGYEETERNIFFLKPLEPLKYEIREVDDAIRTIIQPILDETWGAPYLAINGKLWGSRTMPGFAAVSGDEVLGYLLYEFHGGVCEIMVLESIAQNIGIASTLIEEIKQATRSSGVNRIIVQTSNDNTHAFRFYQRRGFTIREIRLGAMDAARKLKPSIPLIGEESIPLRDEIEFEIEV